jgi:hypothetical protein
MIFNTNLKIKVLKNAFPDLSTNTILKLSYYFIEKSYL